MNIQTVGAWLKRYGWSYQQPEEGSALVALFANEAGQFLVVFQLQPPVLRLSIPVFIPRIRAEVENRVYREILRSHLQSSLVRFALDDSERISILVDLFAGDGIEYAQFEAALDALVDTAETSYARIMDDAQGDVDNG
jgi:hypothetical protein